MNSNIYKQILIFLKVYIYSFEKYDLVDDDEEIEIKFINIKHIGECYVNFNKLFRNDFRAVII